MAESTEAVKRALLRGLARARESWSSLVLAALAAAIAWFIAHDLLGHQQPFFAPIAAAVTLSVSRVQRTQRIVQLVGGVLLGIGIGEGLSAALGASTYALGLIVLVTFLAAVITGVGFVGEGMMFANQAAASAILVVTLHQHGTGAERAVDAIIGGGVALVLGVLLFPAEPLAIVRNAERDVLTSLADTLQHASGLLASRTPANAGWVTARSLDAHQQLDVLSRSQATARRITQVAPRRWPQREIVASEIDRVARLDALADMVLSLARTVASRPGGDELPPGVDHGEVARLGSAMRRLATAPRPWANDLLAEVRPATDHTPGRTTEDHARAVRALLHATTVDLVAVMGGDTALSSLLQVHRDLDNTLSMTPDSEEIPPSSWFDSLESMTKQHEGDAVTIEVLALDIGDEYEAEKVPFAYIEYDRHDDAVNVAVGGRDGRYPVVLRHTIEHPQRVAVSGAPPGEASTVDVTAADGVQTLITFHQRPALPER
jgi:uncharacterized membrane protein YgaE (UPF0421/DUF939 family)